MAEVKARRRRRQMGGIAATLLAVTFATGCGAVNDYSASERITLGAVNTDAGPLALRNLRVELDDGGPVGSGAAVLRGSFVNEGDRDDEVLRVTSPAALAVRLAGAPSKTVPLVAGGVARLEHPEHPGWVLEGTRADLRAGASIPVEFHFAHQGRVAVTVPVAAG